MTRWAWSRHGPLAASLVVLAALLLGNVPLLAVATPLAAPCDPRPPIQVSVVNAGERQLRITVTVTTNASTPTNQLVSVLLNSGSSGLTDIPWERSGSQPPVYHPAPGTQTYSFLLNLAASASEATPVLTFFDVCGPWSWFGGGGPNAFAAALSLAKSHSGSFTQGQQGAQYTLVVSNSGGATTSGLVTVTDTLPSGRTPTTASGTGWSCPTPFANNTVTCTRSDALGMGASYPPIALTVNVAPTAPASVTNTATASGGGAANGMASDVTLIAQLPRLTSPASATFTVGQASTFIVTTSGSPTPAISRGGAALPSGVSFVDNGNGTGTLSGTPAAGTAGTYALTFTATNSAGSSPPQAFTLTVPPPARRRPRSRARITRPSR